MSVYLLCGLSVCRCAYLPAVMSVRLPFCLFVCFDLHHSTWSPSSSVPFPNTRHPPHTLFAPLHASDTQRLLWASAVLKKDSVLFSAHIIRDKERRKALALADFVPLLCRYRLHTHMKEIIIKSISYISLGCLVKMFKVIANFKNTIQHIAFDSTKALMAEAHLCYIFPFFFSTCMFHYFRFTSS